MSQTGKEITASLKSVRRFHTAVAKLLQAASKQMEANKWRVPSRTAACGSSSSRAVYNASFWMPEDAFQFYRHDTNLSLLAYIAVLFDDATTPEKIVEPIATAGWLRFAEESPGWHGQFQFPFCRIVLHTDLQLLGTGAWQSVPPEKILQNDYYQIVAAETFGHPLLAITNESELHAKLLDPLLNRLKETQDVAPLHSTT